MSLWSRAAGSTETQGLPVGAMATRAGRRVAGRRSGQDVKRPPRRASRCCATHRPVHEPHALSSGAIPPAAAADKSSARAFPAILFLRFCAENYELYMRGTRYPCEPAPSASDGGNPRPMIVSLTARCVPASRYLLISRILLSNSLSDLLSSSARNCIVPECCA